MSNTFNSNLSPIEKFCQDRMYTLAVKIDADVGIVIKPKPFWMPSFIYKAVIKEFVEIVNVGGVGGMATMIYKPK